MTMLTDKINSTKLVGPAIHQVLTFPKLDQLKMNILISSDHKVLRAFWQEVVSNKTNLQIEIEPNQED